MPEPVPRKKICSLGGIKNEPASGGPVDLTPPAYQWRRCQCRCQRRCQRTSVIEALEPSWIVVTVAGFASDSAWACLAGAARTNTAPSAARPRTLVIFIDISPSVTGTMPAPCGRSDQPLSTAQTASWEGATSMEVSVCAGITNALLMIVFQSARKI
jgi:hypothetical protein